MKNDLLPNEIEEIKNNEWIIFSTSKDNVPHSIVVMPSKVECNRMILSSIQMEKSIANLKVNPNCFINVYIKENDDKQYKIDCKCEIYDDGDLYNEIKEYEEKNNLPDELKVNAIIIANFKNIDICNG